MKSYTILKTKNLGELLLVADEKALTGVYFADKDHSTRWRKDAKQDAKHPILQRAAEEITDYLNGKRKKFSVPLHFDGTEFQNAVWKQIARIPFGETISYSELAKRAGASSAIRAAGTATGQNPIAIIIPCHRVITKGGTLGGFAGGLDRKTHLLKVENNTTPLELKA